MLPVVGAARERERLEGERQAEYLGCCFERPDPVRHHFGPDAVAGDHGDAEGLLRCSCHLMIITKWLKRAGFWLRFVFLLLSTSLFI